MSVENLHARFHFKFYDILTDSTKKRSWRVFELIAIKLIYIVLISILHSKADVAIAKVLHI